MVFIFHASLQFFLELAAILIIVAIVNYWLLLPTIIMALSLCGLRYVYINTSRSLKRVESLSEFNVNDYELYALLCCRRRLRAPEVSFSKFN